MKKRYLLVAFDPEDNDSDEELELQEQEGSDSYDYNMHELEKANMLLKQKAIKLRKQQRKAGTKWSRAIRTNARLTKEVELAERGLRSNSTFARGMEIMSNTASSSEEGRDDDNNEYLSPVYESTRRKSTRFARSAGAADRNPSVPETPMASSSRSSITQRSAKALQFMMGDESDSSQGSSARKRSYSQSSCDEFVSETDLENSYGKSTASSPKASSAKRNGGGKRAKKKGKGPRQLLKDFDSSFDITSPNRYGAEMLVGNMPQKVFDEINGWIGLNDGTVGLLKPDGYSGRRRFTGAQFIDKIDNEAELSRYAGTRGITAIEACKVLKLAIENKRIIMDLDPDNDFDRHQFVEATTNSSHRFDEELLQKAEE